MKMPIWYFCFITGAVAALIGMSLGIAMGISQDFSLTPVHAHLNLLGWVSMLLYGLYYRTAPRQPTRLAWVQVLMATAGFAAMTGGLWLYLSGAAGDSAQPLIISGALLTTGSMLVFLTVLIKDWSGAAREAV